MSILDVVQQQPLLLCVLGGIAFATFCEVRLIRQKSVANKDAA